MRVLKLQLYIKNSTILFSIAAKYFNCSKFDFFFLNNIHIKRNLHYWTRNINSIISLSRAQIIFAGAFSNHRHLELFIFSFPFLRIEMAISNLMLNDKRSIVWVYVFFFFEENYSVGVLGSIASRCSAGNVLLGEGRPDTREQRKSSLWECIPRKHWISALFLFIDDIFCGYQIITNSGYLAMRRMPPWRIRLLNRGNKILPYNHGRVLHTKIHCQVLIVLFVGCALFSACICYT